MGDSLDSISLRLSWPPERRQWINHPSLPWLHEMRAGAFLSPADKIIGDQEVCNGLLQALLKIQLSQHVHDAPNVKGYQPVD